MTWLRLTKCITFEKYHIMILDKDNNEIDILHVRPSWNILDIQDIVPGYHGVVYTHI